MLTNKLNYASNLNHYRLSNLLRLPSIKQFPSLLENGCFPLKMWRKKVPSATIHLSIHNCSGFTFLYRVFSFKITYICRVYYPTLISRYYGNYCIQCNMTGIIHFIRQTFQKSHIREIHFCWYWHKRHVKSLLHEWPGKVWNRQN